MGRKFISRENAFTIIISSLRKHYTSFHIDQVVEKNILKEIALGFADTKYEYPSVILKVINSSNFKKYVLESIKPKRKMYRKVNIKTLEYVLPLLNINVTDICGSYRNKSDPIYTKLCKALKITDCLKSRMKIYKYWKNLIDTNNSNKIYTISGNKTNTFEYTKQQVDDEITCEKYLGYDKIDKKTENFGINSVLDETINNNIIINGTTTEDRCSKTIEIDIDENESKNDSEITPTDFDIPPIFLNICDTTNKGGEIIPKYSNNVKFLNNNINNKNFCWFLEGTFKIEDTVWNLIYKEGKLDTKLYPYYIRNKIRAYVNNTCLIIFKYVKYLKNDIKIFGKCKHKHCKRFKIILKQNFAHVYSSGLDYCHAQFITLPVRGIERNILKKKLSHCKAFQYKKECLIKSRILFYVKKAKNLHLVKSDATLRKIKSQSSQQLDRNKDDLLDLIEMQRDHPEYLKEICIPFNIKMYSSEQLTVLKSQASDSYLPLIYFDATGGVVRNPIPSFKKRIYFYTAVTQIVKSKRIFPIFSMISACHDSNTIFKLLNDFRYFCEENKYWPAFSGIVSDFSFAILHAAIKAFNKCTFLEYLEKCYRACENEYSLKSLNIVGVYLCCAHFMKMAAKDIDKISKSEDQRKYFKNVIAATILINNLIDFDDFVVNVYVLLMSTTNNHNVENAQVTFNKIINSNKENIKINAQIMDSNIGDNNAVQNDSLYKSSPFYKRFFNLTSHIVIYSSNNI